MPKVKVTISGFVAGEARKAGEVLEITDRQAACGLRRGRIEVLTGGGSKAPKEPEKPKAPEEKPEAPEGLSKGELMAELDKLGVKYRANATVETLQSLLSGLTKADPDPLA